MAFFVASTVTIRLEFGAISERSPAIDLRLVFITNARPSLCLSSLNILGGWVYFDKRNSK